MKKIRVIFIILTIACLAFIWVNSSFDGDESSGISGGVLGFINDFIMKLGFKREFGEHLIRKTAHFIEYAGLSFLLTTDFKLFNVNLREHWNKVLFSGLMVSVIDETIQLFPEGRSSSVADVWIDFAGVCCAFAVTLVLYKFLENKHILKFD
ncbi:MAG: VanZ family protein [Clostridia bacterium]|nr:VanZ family protein [Clostridia bacterium]